MFSCHIRSLLNLTVKHKVIIQIPIFHKLILKAKIGIMYLTKQKILLHQCSQFIQMTDQVLMKFSNIHGLIVIIQNAIFHKRSKNLHTLMLPFMMLTDLMTNSMIWPCNLYISFVFFYNIKKVTLFRAQSYKHNSWQLLSNFYLILINYFTTLTKINYFFSLL